MRRVSTWRIMSLMDAQKEHQDRQLLGVVVRREVMRHSGSSRAFANQVGISVKSLERVYKADPDEPAVSWAKLDLIERVLGLPRDTLRCIYDHKFDQLPQIGVDADLVRWVGQEMAKSQAPSGKPSKAV